MTDSAVASVRKALAAIQWHAGCGAAAMRNCDILSGYDQAKWRLDEIAQASLDLDYALDVLVLANNRSEKRVNGKRSIS
jgi:hypothetical protein